MYKVVIRSCWESDEENGVYLETDSLKEAIKYCDEANKKIHSKAQYNEYDEYEVILTFPDGSGLSVYQSEVGIQCPQCRFDLEGKEKIKFLIDSIK